MAGHSASSVETLEGSHTSGCRGRQLAHHRPLSKAPVTTSKAPVTTSVALVTTSFLLLLLPQTNSKTLTVGDNLFYTFDFCRNDHSRLPPQFPFGGQGPK